MIPYVIPKADFPRRHVIPAGEFAGPLPRLNRILGELGIDLVLRVILCTWVLSIAIHYLNKV